MSVSSLQKKMFTGKMLVLVFLVGLLSLTFLVIKVSNVFAATAAPVAPTSTLTGASTTAQSISFSWTAPSGFSGSKWVVASSTNRVPTDAQIAVITDTSTLTFTVNGLATNTAYYLGAAGGDATGATSSYATSSQTYTLADTPGTPTVDTAAIQGFKVTINSSSNVVAATTYIVRDTAQATLQYLQNDGTWGTASGTTFTAVQLGAINGTTSIQLATNSLHRISVAAVNGNTITTSFSSSADIVTLAATPGTPTISATATTGFTLTINSSTNPATTTFVVRDTGGTTLRYLQSDGTWGTSSSTTFTAVQLGAISGTSTTGLTANTTHTISVAAVNGNRVTSSFGSAVTFNTHANIPSSVALASGANAFTLTWSGDATEYYAEDVTGGTNSGWITATNYSVLNVNCGTTRTFRVKGRNGDNVETSVSTSTTGTTNACGGSGTGGGGGGAPANPFATPAIPATPAKPAVPGVSPAVPATPATPASPAAGKGSSGSLPSTASPVAVFVHTLRPGTRGGEVRQLQQKLRELGFFTYPTNTGFFGSATRAAVVAFQKDQGLKPYPGHVGPATRAALNSL